MSKRLLDLTGLTTMINRIKGLLNLKQDLVSNPVNNEILITDAIGQAVSSGTDLSQLLFDVDAGKNAFMLYDYSRDGMSITLPSVTSDVANTSIPNVDIDIGETMAETWAVAGMVKYEVFNGSTRLNAMPICAFSMDQQRVLRLRMMVAGPSSKTMTKLSGAVLLKHR